jgi:hypothetical protein
MNEDERFAAILRERLHAIAEIVDHSAPAAPRAASADSIRPRTGLPSYRPSETRSMLRAAIALGIVGILAAAFLLSWRLRINGTAADSDSPQPIPSLTEATSQPSLSPLPSLAHQTPYPTFGAGWPLQAPCDSIQDQGVCMFAPDGSLYLVGPGTKPLVYAYDPSGRPRAGWPITAPDGVNYEANAGYAIAKDGSLLAWTVTGISDIQSDGRMHAGWPVPLTGDPSSSHAQILVEPDGRILVAQSNSKTGDLWVLSLTTDGDSPTVWSRHLTGNYVVNPLIPGPDGELFVFGNGGGSGTYSATVLGSDGKVLAAWSGDGMPVAVTPAGDLVLFSRDVRSGVTGNERGTVLSTGISLVDASGRTLPGWPYSTNGPVSRPAIASDGSMYFVTGDGSDRTSVLALDSSGAVLPGWPTSLAAGYAPLLDAENNVLKVGQPPLLTSKNVVVALLANDGSATQLVGVQRSGPTRTTWSHPLPLGSVAPQNALVAMLVSGDTVYVAGQIDATGYVEAIGADGLAPTGWPYIFKPGPLFMTVLSDGGVGVASHDFATSLLPDGSVAR